MQEIENLETLTNLQQLWLGRNRISEIQNLSALTLVRQLSLQANRLESMAGVSVMIGLEELYLSQNGIKKIEDLAPLTKLTILDLAMNEIEEVRNHLALKWQAWASSKPKEIFAHRLVAAHESVAGPCVCLVPSSELMLVWERLADVHSSTVQVSGLEAQTRLTDLWLNNNPIKDLDHIAAAVASCKDTLTVVYLEGSPAAKSTDAYLHIMKQMLPKLEYLDSTPISR